jgi:conjugal transfer/entry exclusion protein
MRRRKHVEGFSLFSFQDIICSVTGIMILLTLFLTLQLVQRKSFGTPSGHAESNSDLTHSIQNIEGQIEQLDQALQSGHQFLTEFAGLSPTSLDQEERRLQQTIATLQTEISELQPTIESAQTQNQALRKTTNASSAHDELATLRNGVIALKRQLESLKAANRVVYNVAPDVKKAAWLVDLLDGSIKVSKAGSKNLSIEFQDRPDSRSVEQFLSWAGNHDPTSDYFVVLVRPKSLTTYRQIFNRLDELHFAIGVDLLERDAMLIDMSEHPAVVK